MNLREIVNVSKIVAIMKAWSTACHMATICLYADCEYVTGQIGFTDFCTKYTRLTEEGEARCRYCDRHNEGVYYCHAGLMNFGFDIVLDNGEVVGRIVGGQVLSSPIDEAKIVALAEELDIPKEEYLEAARSIPIRDEESIRAAAFMLNRIINYLVNSEYAKLRQEKYIHKLDRISKCDSLTGLYNHGYCKDVVGQLITDRQPFALYLFDLDDYKNVNDTYGHIFGDTVLTRFSDTLERLKPPGAVVGRHGGDEFIVIAPASCYEEVRLLAQTIQDRTKRLHFHENPSFQLTTSAGISIYPNHSDTVKRLYENADLALYTVKGRGGDGYLVYKSSMRVEKE